MEARVINLEEETMITPLKKTPSNKTPLETITPSNATTPPNKTFKETLPQRVKKAVVALWKSCKDKYFERAEEDMGEYSIEYYEPNGSIRYLDNVNPVEECAVDRFICELTAKDSCLVCDLFQYMEENEEETEEETEEEEREKLKYVDNLSYEDVYEMIC
jgi:hypothetical protein